MRAAVDRPDSDKKFDGYVPKTAFFFPGQGAQTVGMAKDVCAEVPKAKELFDELDSSNPGGKWSRTKMVEWAH